MELPIQTPKPKPKPNPKPGLLFVITGASGVGKGTLIRQLLQDRQMFYSISWTTRAARTGEQDGIHYHFRSSAEFAAELEQGAGFLEHAEFVGNSYGTPRAPVEAALEKGEDVLLEIEVLGAMQVKQSSPEAILIFVIPPTLQELRNRLVGRGTESLERIEKRLARAREEIRAAHDFRYIVINDQLETAVDEIRSIVIAEKLRSERWQQSELEELLS
jgi:guanylate kinase